MKISDNMTLSKAIVAMFTACVTGPDKLTYGAWSALSQLGRSIFQHTEAVNELAAQFQDAHIELLGKPYEYTPKVSGQARGGDRNERIKALKSGLKASNG